MERNSLEKANGGCWGVTLWCFVFVFSEFCVSRSFRTVGFVAATFVRFGKNGCLTDVLKVTALWCFVAGFYVIVLFHVGTSVCAQY